MSDFWDGLHKTASDYDDIDAQWNAAYWKGQADAARAREKAIQKLLSMKGQKVVVTRGRKVPIGTTGTAFYVGEGQWGWRVGFNTDDGQTIWIDAGNVQLASEAKAASKTAAADYDHCPVCGKRILDYDMEGMEAEDGQRWCIKHAPPEEVARIEAEIAADSLPKRDINGGGWPHASQDPLTGQWIYAARSVTADKDSERAENPLKLINRIPDDPPPSLFPDGEATHYGLTPEQLEFIQMRSQRTAANVLLKDDGTDITCQVCGQPILDTEFASEGMVTVSDDLCWHAHCYPGELPKTAAVGPNGFWCRYCGKYQSARNATEVKAVRKHLQDHEDAGDQPKKRGSLTTTAEDADPFHYAQCANCGEQLQSTEPYADRRSLTWTHVAPTACSSPEPARGPWMGSLTTAAGDPEVAQLGRIMDAQQQDLKERGVSSSGQPLTRPCRYCGADANFTTIYRSFPAAYANYDCPVCFKETHYKPLAPGETAEATMKTAAFGMDEDDGPNPRCEYCGKRLTNKEVDAGGFGHDICADCREGLNEDDDEDDDTVTSSLASRYDTVRANRIARLITHRTAD